MNDKIVGFTNLDKTQINFGLLFAVPSDELQLVNVFSASTVAMLCSEDLLYLLNCVTETVQVNAGLNCFLEGRMFVRPAVDHIADACNL
jgi:hypothetical protein